jgi:type II secretory pathway component PulK
MTMPIRRPIARLFVALSLLAAATMTAAAQDSYEKAIQTWRAEREAELKADDGWLTLSGLFWPREGFNPAPRRTRLAYSS